MAMSGASSRSSALASPPGTGSRLLLQSSTTARSTSPRSTSRSPCSGSSSRVRTVRSGWSARREVSIAGNSPRAAVGKAQIRTSPTTSPRCASMSDWASSTCDRIRAAWSASSRPAIGEADAAAVSGEQPLPHLALQLRQLLGDRRRRDVQPVGRPAHRAVAGEGVQRAQPLQVQHVSDATRSSEEGFTCPKTSSSPGWTS